MRQAFGGTKRPTNGKHERRISRGDPTVSRVRLGVQRHKKGWVLLHNVPFVQRRSKVVIVVVVSHRVHTGSVIVALLWVPLYSITVVVAVQHT